MTIRGQDRIPYVWPFGCRDLCAGGCGADSDILSLYQKRKLETTGDVLTIRQPAGVPLGNGFLCGFSYCNSAERTVWRAGTYITGQFPDGFIYNIDCRFSGIFHCGNDFDEEAACSDQKEIIRMRRHVRNFSRISFLHQMDAFGLENKIPDKKEIVAANINCYFDIEENSESGIDEIMSIHQQIIDSKKEFQAYQGRLI